MISAARRLTKAYDRYRNGNRGNRQYRIHHTLSLLGDSDHTTYVRCFAPWKKENFCVTFEEPLNTPGIRVQTGLPHVIIDLVDYARVEYSPDGILYKRADCLWVNGGCRFVPDGPVRSVKLVFENGNQPLTYYLQDLLIEK